MRNAGELKTSLFGQHIIKTDTAELVANVSEVMVMPQGYGSIYAMSLTDAGEINRAHTHRRTGVCDVGTYTVDLALDDDGEYVDAESGSVESGVFTAQERIAAVLVYDEVRAAYPQARLLHGTGAIRRSLPADAGQQQSVSA